MNNDLISRSAMHAMVCLDTKRGAYGEFMDGSEVYFTSEEVHDMLDEAPAVDAVVPVRCKDCVKRHTSRCALWYGNFNGNDIWLDRGDVFYCPLGERRVNE